MWQQVLKQLNKYPKDRKYIVGVSGGCDSMCLLDLLYHQGYQVIVCHVNYNFRAMILILIIKLFMITV